MEKEIDWEQLEIRLVNCFWRLMIFGIVLNIVQTTPGVIGQFIIFMGLLWMLHFFAISITGTFRTLKKKNDVRHLTVSK